MHCNSTNFYESCINKWPHQWVSHGIRQLPKRILGLSMDQLQAEKATTLHAQIIFHIKEKMHEWGSPRVQREMENNELRSQWWGAESRPHRGTFPAPSARALARSSPQDSWKVIHQQIVPLDAPQLLNWRIFGDQHSSLTLKCWMWGGQMICYFTGFWIKNNGIKGSPLNLIADFVVLNS